MLLINDGNYKVIKTKLKTIDWITICFVGVIHFMVASLAIFSMI